MDRTAAAIVIQLIFFVLSTCVSPPLSAQADTRPPKGERKPKKDRPGGKGKKGGRGSKNYDRFAADYPVVYHDLWIPPLIEGNDIDLTLAESSKPFWAPTQTKTYGYNGATFLGPTVVLEKGEAVNLRVHNTLHEETTVHWHGLYLPPTEDGGPHQIIRPGDSLTSSFVVDNHAATYWYHPHPHEATQDQITYGAGGLIIIRDEIESALSLPRSYGIDDIPLIFTSRRFYDNDQFSFEGDDDKYGDYLLTNGDFHAQVELPAQWVRLRLLNCEIERGYRIGFSDNRTFYQIATDGGLVDRPVPLQLLPLAVGERAEILLDLREADIGSTFELMSFNEGQPFGFPGGEPGKGGSNGSLLNNLDFSMLKITVGPRTENPCLTVPTTLTQNTFWSEADVDRHREMTINKKRGGTTFQFNHVGYDRDVVNQVVRLGDVEAWTINNPVFGHSFHIHDVQFKIVKREGAPPPPYEQGWKDTFYLPMGSSVTFLTKFEKYASDTVPFMYHCHMANHEDEGLMGQFLVSTDPESLPTNSDGTVDISRKLTAEMAERVRHYTMVAAPDFSAPDIDGHSHSLAELSADDKVLILYFIESSCPCSWEALPHLADLQKHYPDTCHIVGVINATEPVTRSWVQRSGATFPILCDPDCSIIQAYGAEAAAYTTLISPDRQIIQTYPGFSASNFRDIETGIVQHTTAVDRNIDLSSASVDLVVGCSIESAAGIELASLAATTSPTQSPKQQRPPPSTTQTSQKPNIIIFISDDMGWNDVGYNGSAIETPHIDRLAREGMRLDRFYVHPICSPTRAAFMTGRSPARFRILGPLTGDRGVPAGEHFFPESFQTAGYQTALIGKWHLGPGTGEYSPTKRGFHYFYGFRAGMIDYYTHINDTDKHDWWRWDEPLKIEGYSTDLIANEAVRVIQKRDPEKPLLLVVPFNAPHGPSQAPEDLISKYQTTVGGKRAQFAACVDAMDQGIGRVLGTLDDLQIAENTIVMFFCDNGGKTNLAAGEEGLNLIGGKGRLTEGGIRVPTVIRWPARLPAGSKSEHFIAVQDLGATLASAAGIELKNQQPLDGSSQWAALSKSQMTERDPIVIAGGKGGNAIIDDPYKLIISREGELLYDLRQDPTEQTDLSSELPEIVADLKKAWEPFASMAGKGAKGGKGGKGKKPKR